MNKNERREMLGRIFVSVGWGMIVSILTLVDVKIGAAALGGSFIVVGVALATRDEDIR